MKIAELLFINLEYDLKDFLTIVLATVCLSACVYSKGVVDKLFVKFDHVKAYLSGPPSGNFEKVCEIVMVQPALDGKKVRPEDVSDDLKSQAAKCGAKAVYLESLKQPGKKVEIRGYGINFVAKAKPLSTELQEATLIKAIKTRNLKKIKDQLEDIATFRDGRSRKDNKTLTRALKVALRKGSNCYQPAAKLLVEDYKVAILNMRRFRGDYLFCSDLATEMFELLESGRQRIYIDIAIQKLIHIHRDYQPIDSAKLTKLYNFFVSSKEDIEANICDKSQDEENDICDRRLRIRTVANHLVRSTTTELEPKFMSLAILLLEITRR